ACYYCAGVCCHPPILSASLRLLPLHKSAPTPILLASQSYDCPPAHICQSSSQPAAACTLAPAGQFPTTFLENSQIRKPKCNFVMEVTVSKPQVGIKPVPSRQTGQEGDEDLLHQGSLQKAKIQV
ncbi:hypothetical protein DSO57_1039424, partial [Entomophthora muscae]